MLLSLSLSHIGKFFTIHFMVFLLELSHEILRSMERKYPNISRYVFFFETFLAMFFFENETFLAMLVTFSGQLWKQNNKIMLASFLDVMFLFIYLFLNKNYIWWLRLTGQSTCIGKVCSFYINCILSNLSFSSDQPPIYYRIT